MSTKHKNRIQSKTPKKDIRGRRKGKKLINSIKVTAHSIHFKSRLEALCYEMFYNKGFYLQYEPNHRITVNGRVNKVPTYLPENDRTFNKKRRVDSHYIKSIELYTRRILNIKYTCDFEVVINEDTDRETTVFIECKGIENPTYTIRRKLFLLYLNRLIDEGQNVVFFEVHTKEQIQQCIDKVKELVVQ